MKRYDVWYISLKENSELLCMMCELGLWMMNGVKW